MNRREFLGWVGVGGLASSLPVAIAACSPQTSQQPVSSPRADGFQMIGNVSELNDKGQILAKKTAVAKVLVIRDPKNSNHLIAVNPTCTHAGCTVTWQQNSFVCPCHDSKFASDGKVLQGPAKQPLPTYIAKVEGNSVLVKIS